MTPSPICFLTVNQVLTIHARVLAEYGGAAGIRDPGLLDSAVAMPAASFGGEHLHDGIPAMAAAYLFHICKNHAFVDGNKRAGLGAAIQFLYLNNYTLDASKDDVEILTLSVADGSVRKEAVIGFFNEHARAVAPVSRKAKLRPRKRRRKDD
jgi:death-on-curing protein